MDRTELSGEDDLVLERQLADARASPSVQSVEYIGALYSFWSVMHDHQVCAVPLYSALQKRADSSTR